MKTAILLFFVSFAALTSFAQSWGLTGNSNTKPGKNFLGTTDEKGLVLSTNNIERLRITKNGIVGIGTANPRQQLDVNGNINLGEGSGLYIGNERVFHTSGGPDASYLPNVFVGQFAGNNFGGAYNTAVGYAALRSVRFLGEANVAMGYNALTSNTLGSGNSALGFFALTENTNGNNNTACGVNALFFNITGSSNAALGGGALESNSSGSNNTAVGNYADINAGNITNSTIIGYSALAMASNQVRIGNSDVISIGGYTNWTNISDGRVKKNIKNNVPGLTFINKLKPLTYNLDLDAADKIVQRPTIKTNDGKIIGSSGEDATARKAKEQIVYTGFIAQDVEKAAKELKYDFSGVDAAKNDKDLYGLRYAEFVVPLVKAVQELSAKNDDLQKQIDELKATVLSLNQNSFIASNQKSETINSNASALDQNTPNPFKQSTSVHYSLSSNFSSAQIVVADYSGKTLKQINVPLTQKGILNIDAGSLAAGTYTYSLMADGKLIDTKKMIVAK